jgi:hypothetical protein
MSIRMPLPSHAPAARPISGNEVMSWQASVIGDGNHAMPEGCCGVGSVFWRPSIAPVCWSVNNRGSLTIAAVSGAATGTLMTSIRQRDGFSPEFGPLTRRAARETHN